MHQNWTLDDVWLWEEFSKLVPKLESMNVAELERMLESSKRMDRIVKRAETYGAKFDNRFDRLQISDNAIRRRGSINAAINYLVDNLDMTHAQVAHTTMREILALMARAVKQRTTAKTLHPIALEILAVLVQS